MKKYIFFRNDDVRDVVDDELVKLIDICVSANVPIALAVEPANITKEVIDYLVDQKKKHGKLIELIQHGYNHNKDGAYPKGTEFGSQRGFDDQYADINKGKQIMDTNFNTMWFPAMAFPYGSYNSNSLLALDKAGYLLSTAGVNFNLKNRFKNFLGRLAVQDLLFGKKVSYHNNIRGKYNFLQMDTSVNIMKKQLSVNKAEHYTLEEIIAQIENNFKYTNVVGILFHHRFHTDEFEMISKIVDWLKKNNYEFCSLEQLNNNFRNNKMGRLL